MRPKMPANMDKSLADVIRKCLLENPADRPTIKQLMAYFDDQIDWLVI
jgi:serine/threonine protein kinase